MLLKQHIDFGRTAKDYACYRAGFPESFFTRIADEGFLDAVGAVLDAGTGTGTVARGLALKGLEVTGVDPAQALLDYAAALDKEAGVRVRYCVGKAEKYRYARRLLILSRRGNAGTGSISLWFWLKPSCAAPSWPADSCLFRLVAWCRGGTGNVPLT